MLRRPALSTFADFGSVDGALPPMLASRYAADVETLCRTCEPLNHVLPTSRVRDGASGKGWHLEGLPGPPGGGDQPLSGTSSLVTSA